MGLFNIFQGKDEEKPQVSDATRQSSSIGQGLDDISKTDFENVRVDAAALEAKIGAEDDAISREVAQKLTELHRSRQELASISSDLTSGENLYKSSMDKIKQLSVLLSESEVQLATLKRINVENRTAQTELASLKNELERERMWAKEQEIRANTFEERHKELSGILIEARKQLTQLIEKSKLLSSKVESQEQTISQIESLRTELAKDLEKYKKDANYYRTLSEKLTEDVSVYARTSLEMEKRIDELSAANKHGKREREEMEHSLKSLVEKYNDLKADNFSTKSKLETALFEVKSTERNYSEKIKYRENELFSLRATIEELKSQLRVKEQMSTRMERDLTDWKKHAREESQKVHELELRLHDQAEELAKNREALAQSRANSDDINQRFLSALADLDKMKELNAALIRKLEEYSAVGGVPTDLDAPAAEKKRKAKQEAEMQEGEIDLSTSSKH